MKDLHGCLISLLLYEVSIVFVLQHLLYCATLPGFSKRKEPCIRDGTCEENWGEKEKQLIDNAHELTPMTMRTTYVVH